MPDGDIRVRRGPRGGVRQRPRLLHSAVALLLLAAVGCGGGDGETFSGEALVTVVPCDTQEAVETALAEVDARPAVVPHRLLDRGGAYDPERVVDLRVEPVVALPEGLPSDVPVREVRISVYREKVLATTWTLGGGAETMQKLGAALRERYGTAAGVSERPGDDVIGAGSWLSIVWERPEHRIRLTQQGDEVRLSSVCDRTARRLLDDPGPNGPPQTAPPSSPDDGAPQTTTEEKEDDDARMDG